MDNQTGENAEAGACQEDDEFQIFEYSKAHQIVNGYNCLDANDGLEGSFVRLENCNKERSSQLWDYDEHVRFI